MVQNMKDKTLHMIGNAHIDPVWLWTWQEGFYEVKATFRSVLDRMNEYDDFTFVASSAVFYEWVEHSDPEMFAEICRRVAEGRWELTGGWWLQPDCNIPAGESLVRQGLYGQRYFHEKFGRIARVGYNVDSFGHAGTLPQILKKSGLDYYIFGRPGPHEMGLPRPLFWWESDDGSRVLAYRIPYEYLSTGKELDKHIRRVAGGLKPPFDELMAFYGVGNHGGGPTRANIESIQALDQDPLFPRLIFSTPERYFAAIKPRDLPIPIVHAELQHHASGTYVAHSGIKRGNREAENRLLAAEKFATIAEAVTGQPYPADLEQAWKSVLFNQFHDILAGTSIPSAYVDAAHLHGEAMAIADRALNYAVQALAWQVRVEPEEEMRPIIVFNPNAWESRVVVEVELGRIPDPFILLDDEGRELPVQRVQQEAAARGRNRIAFVADLPALGYRTYRVIPGAPADFPRLEASDTLLESERFRLEFDPESGAIRSLHDKQHGVDVFSDQAAVPVVLRDPSDTWGHHVFRFQDVEGQFMATSMRLAEHGPVRSVVRVNSAYGDSRLRQEFALYPGLEQIDVRVTVEWRESQRALKLRFPLNLFFIHSVFEVPYGHAERAATGEEEPGQAWLDVTGISYSNNERYGLSILNNGKYSGDVLLQDIGLTVLRSPIYAHHVPFEPPPDHTFTIVDQGVQRFSYSLLPHDQSWEEAGTVRRAAELNQRPITLLATYRPEAPLPQRASYLSVDQPNVLVSVLKRAEDGDGLILRAYETDQIGTRTTIRLEPWERIVEAEFAPCEIKTFRIPENHDEPVVETSMIELDEVGPAGRAR